MAFVSQQFADHKLEMKWQSERIEQQKINRFVRYQCRLRNHEELDVEVGSFSTDWTTDGGDFSISNRSKVNANLKDMICLRFCQGIGIDVVAKKDIDGGSCIGMLNGQVMEFTDYMYNFLDHICMFNHESLYEQGKLVPLYNVSNKKRVYDGCSNSLYVGLLSTRHGSSLKYINSTCIASNKNVSRFVISFGNSLNICYYASKFIKRGQSLVDDYMRDNDQCVCYKLKMHCKNQNK